MTSSLERFLFGPNGHSGDIGIWKARHEGKTDTDYFDDLRNRAHEHGSYLAYNPTRGYHTVKLNLFQKILRWFGAYSSTYLPTVVNQLTKDIARIWIEIKNDPEKKTAMQELAARVWDLWYNKHPHIKLATLDELYSITRPTQETRNPLALSNLSRYISIEQIEGENSELDNFLTQLPQGKTTHEKHFYLKVRNFLLGIKSDKLLNPNSLFPENMVSFFDSLCSEYLKNEREFSGAKLALERFSSLLRSLLGVDALLPSIRIVADSSVKVNDQASSSSSSQNSSLVQTPSGITRQHSLGHTRSTRRTGSPNLINTNSNSVALNKQPSLETSSSPPELDRPLTFTLTTSASRGNGVNTGIAPASSSSSSSSSSSDNNQLSVVFAPVPPLVLMME